MKKKTLYILFLVALLNSSCSVLEKFKKEEQGPQLTTEDVIRMVMSQQEPVSQDTTVTKLGEKEQAEYKKELEKRMEEGEEKEPNWVQRTWYKIFPKKVERDFTYPEMYKEKPKTIMVVYPWNRSKEKFADEMFYSSICEELTLKGYYVLPALPLLDEFKADTLFSSQYYKKEDTKKLQKKYGVDAVLYVTIYSMKKEWWTTNVNINAQYDLISAKTNENLFSRHADFNYDSQMPTKKKNKKSLIEDEKENHYLGICQKMQRYVFVDLPIGPYHKDYLLDQKRFSHKKDMRYKVNVKPS
ncbi:MAG: DUF799 family lipoprotein [Bacteroidales bacterium]|jgi:hypothetical protein|nr:DUF799 family lipoprotein [Bacteroidales bacterium]